MSGGTIAVQTVQVHILQLKQQEEALRRQLEMITAHRNALENLLRTTRRADMENPEE